MDLSKEIVISGIAGRYPKCDSFDDFKNALLNGTDMITEDSKRFQPGLFGTPKRAGKINGIEYFDADFFGVTSRQANAMDPRHRVTIETTFEAIIDSGYNPNEIRGSKTGVYVGLGYLDTQGYSEDDQDSNGYKLIGSSLALIANRTSFCFDFRGPSIALDTACSSSLYALALAVKAMEYGEIDSAVVSAVSINFNPYETRECLLLNLLAKDGKCKVFSRNRDGFARSEGVVTLFLQRKSDCRRMYATILGAEMNCDGFKLEGISVPSGESQTRLIRSLYETKQLNVRDVSYVEIHGTGTHIGDYIECKSISDVFCTERTDPLLTGSVKSNMGHGEMAAGLCAVSKVLVAMETGLIPANLHCDDVDYSLPGLDNGKLKVVAKNTKWNGGMVSLNSFGFGGANAHVILKSNPKQKMASKLENSRLVNVSGRTEEAVQHYINKLKNIQHDEEALALIDTIHKTNVNGHIYRGFVVLGECSISDVHRFENKKRPIWFIYSGMGSQWTGMGRDLMKIKVFKSTFMRCKDTLKPYGVDLEKNIFSDDPSVLDDIINCFSTITAVQIALTDVLKSLGIEADAFAGHSLGETGCAYYNGDLTPEQAILLGFARGYATVQSDSEKNGQMASIGLSYQKCCEILPKGISIACVNTDNNVTISGLKESVIDFVSTLKKRNIYTKLVNSGGYAFHSAYTQNATAILQDFARKIITDPKPRSTKWISSSWKETEWKNPLSKMNSAEYTTHNFENLARFDQVLRHIPKNAVVIEIAPHGLLTPLIRKELGSGVSCLTLGNRNAKNNLDHFLSNIGKLYLNGSQPDLTKLYNKVSFPVARGTCNIGSFIKWDHNVKWRTPFFNPKTEFGKKITVNTNTDEYGYLLDYEIQGQVVMPLAGYLELVWKVFADLMLKNINYVPIIFESIKLHSNTVLPHDQNIYFWINIMKHTGYFEIFDGEVICCQGKVNIFEDDISEFESDEPFVQTSRNLKKNEIYKILNLKGLRCLDHFQCLETIDLDGSKGIIRWSGNYTTFLSSMFRIPTISQYSSSLLMPSEVKKVIINPEAFLDASKESDRCVYYDGELIKSNGLKISNIVFSRVTRRQNIQDNLILQKHGFIPFEHRGNSDLSLSISMALQIIFENAGIARNLRVRKDFKFSLQRNDDISQIIENLLKMESYISVEFIEDDTSTVEFIVSDHSDIGIDNLANDGFVLFIGENTLMDKTFTLIYSSVCEGSFTGVYLLRRITQLKTCETINVDNNKFEWIDKIKQAISQNVDVVYLTSSGNDISGIMGLVRCLNFEPCEKTSFKCFFMKDRESETIDLNSSLCRQQARKKLAFNVLKDGVWGSYRYLPMKDLMEIDVLHACSGSEPEGDVSSFRWYENPSNYSAAWPSSEYVFVFYSGLNINDIQTPAGKLLSLSGVGLMPCGVEYSGLTKTGVRIMGLACGTTALQIMSNPVFSWKLPDTWKLEEAATIPFAYSMAYYALIIKANMKRNRSILIHSGTENISMAAINISLTMDCELYITVSSEESRAFLLTEFPRLKSANIANSTTDLFTKMIKKGTNGNGVDIVLNTASKDLIEPSVWCLAKHGHLIQIRRNNCDESIKINADAFSNDISFHLIKFNDLLFDDIEAKQQVNKLICDGLFKGNVRPLPRKIYSELQVNKALENLYVADGIGKTLIKIRNEDSKTLANPERSIKALPRLYFSRSGTYILIGGLGGFGLELAQFLISRGARKIILNSRRGLSTGYQSYCLKKWSMIEGVTVKISTENSSNMEGAENLVTVAENLGVVKGIFNLAMILEDALFVKQTAENFKKVFDSKINSGNNMDIITRRRCPELEHFVVWSSVTSGRGNPGQTNYGMANSALERLCERRRENGLPALAIQFGPVGDVGAVAESSNSDRVLRVAGLTPQNIVSCLKSLEYFMLQTDTVVTTHVLDKRASKSSTTDRKSPIEIISFIMGINNIDTVDTNRPLSQMGLDSLMASEIKQTLLRNFNIETEAESIKYLTLDEIAKFSMYY